MNIEQAKAIALTEILKKIGSTPVKQKSNDIWYNLPFRYEKTASFHINALKNENTILNLLYKCLHSKVATPV